MRALKAAVMEVRAEAEVDVEADKDGDAQVIESSEKELLEVN